MPLDKHYPNRKDQCSPYYKSGRFDRSCRPGGSCPYCRENRLHSAEVKEESSKEQVREFKQEL